MSEKISMNAAICLLICSAIIIQCSVTKTWKTSFGSKTPWCATTMRVCSVSWPVASRFSLLRDVNHCNSIPLDIVTCRVALGSSPKHRYDANTRLSCFGQLARPNSSDNASMLVAVDTARTFHCGKLKPQTFLASPLWSFNTSKRNCRCALSTVTLYLRWQFLWLMQCIVQE